MVVDRIVEPIEYQQAVAIAFKKILVTHACLNVGCIGGKAMIAFAENIALRIKTVRFSSAFWVHQISGVPTPCRIEYNIVGAIIEWEFSLRQVVVCQQRPANWRGQA